MSVATLLVLIPGLFLFPHPKRERILGECLLVSGLPGRTSRTLVDIVRLAESIKNVRANMHGVLILKFDFINHVHIFEFHISSIQAVNNPFILSTLCLQVITVVVCR